MVPPGTPEFRHLVTNVVDSSVALYPLDGDGSRDFVSQDDSVLYQFGSYASSYSPPRVFNIYKGALVDVSSEPGFRVLWERFAAKTKVACANRASQGTGGDAAGHAWMP